MDIIEFFEHIEDTNEDGNPMAIITIQNETFPTPGDQTPLIHDEASTDQAVVSFAMNRDTLITALLWDDFDDTDYLRFKGFLKEYEREIKAQNNEPPHYIVLNLADAETYEHFITCIVLTYVIDGERPMIRFLSQTEDAAIYTLSDEEMATLTDEVADELEATEDLAGIDYIPFN